MKQIIVIVAVLLSAGIHAQTINFDKDTAAIEKKFSAEMDKATDRIEILSAIGKASDSYDALLNKYYKACLAKVKPSDKNTFIEAQRQWLKWLESEKKIISLKYDPKYIGMSDMSIYQIAEDEMNITKQRVVQVYQYWESFSLEL